MSALAGKSPALVDGSKPHWEFTLLRFSELQCLFELHQLDTLCSSKLRIQSETIQSCNYFTSVDRSIRACVARGVHECTRWQNPRHKAEFVLCTVVSRFRYSARGGNPEAWVVWKALGFRV